MKWFSEQLDGRLGLIHPAEYVILTGSAPNLVLRNMGAFAAKKYKVLHIIVSGAPVDIQKQYGPAVLQEEYSQNLCVIGMPPETSVEDIQEVVDNGKRYNFVPDIILVYGFNGSAAELADRNNIPVFHAPYINNLGLLMSYFADTIIQCNSGPVSLDIVKSRDTKNQHAPIKFDVSPDGVLTDTLNYTDIYDFIAKHRAGVYVKYWF